MFWIFEIYPRRVGADFPIANSEYQYRSSGEFKIPDYVNYALPGHGDNCLCYGCWFHHVGGFRQRLADA